jgi:hypothetical protein
VFGITLDPQGDPQRLADVIVGLVENLASRLRAEKRSTFADQLLSACDARAFGMGRDQRLAEFSIEQFRWLEAALRGHLAELEMNFQTKSSKADFSASCFENLQKLMESLAGDKRSIAWA